MNGSKIQPCGNIDAGAIICLHDKSSTVAGLPDLVKVFTSVDQKHYANPQGRRIITINECLEGDDERHDDNESKTDVLNQYNHSRRA